jgi:cysteine desulfurase/selenocysteine lyase
MSRPGLYLDHAATSFPKPASVLAAVQRWYEQLGVSGDRGDGSATTTVRREVLAVRTRLGTWLDVPRERVAFTSGATESLNLALRALLRPGDHVLTTAFEHSSVVRPLRHLQRERALRLDVLPPDADGSLSPDAVRTALAARPRLFVCTHASNVTGACFDAAAFCELARGVGTTTLLDASQTAGLVDLRVGADLVVGSGHKGLHGPPGIGFLAVRADLDLAPQKQGGTGSSTALDEHPNTWPAAFEAGTPNTPAILGLGAALAWLDQQRPAALLARGLDLLAALATALAPVPGVRVLAPRRGARVPVLSVVRDGFDPAELGAMLASAGIQARSGHHCAPWLHDHLGTPHGTLRFSPGPSQPGDWLDRVLAAIGVTG